LIFILNYQQQLKLINKTMQEILFNGNNPKPQNQWEKQGNNNIQEDLIKNIYQQEPEQEQEQPKLPAKSKKGLVIAVVVIILVAWAAYAWRAGENQNGSTNESENKLADKTQLKNEQPVPAVMKGSPVVEGEGILVYFSKTEDADCGQVYPLERSVEGEYEPISTSLIQLFMGPTAEEKEQGYTSLFSQKTAYILKWVKITGGNVADVNLNDIREIIPNASSSCGSAQLLAEIENTIRQHGNIEKIRIAIDGDPQVFYDWIQIGCQDDLCDSAPFEAGLQ